MSTYVPRPIDTSGVSLDSGLNQLIETLAANTHDHWSKQRIAEGWRFGHTRDDAEKTHPDLVPYEDLTESEKEYDRLTVRETLKAILALGYAIRR
jgi:hypothetical protein